MLLITQLIWNEWNIAHIARHEVIPQEVEEVCNHQPMTSATYDGRLRVVGEINTNRIITVILAPVEAGRYYVVTAHTASHKERQLYEIWKQEGGEQAA